MKVILIQPPGFHSIAAPPLGLAYIASSVKTSEISVRIFDLNVENLSIEKILHVEKPDILGLSCVVTNAYRAFEIANKAKSSISECFVVMGGPYPSMMGKNLLVRHNEVDAVVVGEGEVTADRLFQKLQNEKGLNNVRGLIFRNHGAVQCNPVRSPMENLDKLPLPERDQLPMKLYGENAGTLFTSRGCPYQCSFCSRPVFGRKWRGHSPQYVLDELEQIITKYGLNHVSFLDDNFTFDLDRAAEILEGIASKDWKLSLYFWNGIRVDHATRDLLGKMKKAGCSAINYGVESVDSKVLANIRKDISLEQVENAVKLTRKLGIRTNLFIMVGNPGDNLSIVDKMRSFIGRIKVDGIHLSLATPYPGTDFWDWVEENGRWLVYDRQELLDWPIDDIPEAYPVFETTDFTAKERIWTYRKIRSLLSDKGLLV